MSTYYPNLCRSCKHLNKDGISCVAFKKIPNRIRIFGEDHREPVAGDHGVQYSPDLAKSADLEDWLLVNEESAT